MKKLAHLIILTLFISNSNAQQHFIKTDLIGYAMPTLIGSVKSCFQEYTPIKFSLAYENKKDTINQSFIFALSYGSTLGILMNLEDSVNHLTNVTGLGIYPEYRYYLEKKQQKLKLFGSVGGMLTIGKLNSYSFSGKDYALQQQDKKNIIGLGLNFGGGAKYCFAKHLYTELLINYGFPIYRSNNLLGLENMFYRFELGIGYYFTTKK